ncbi:hypothetical protein [Sporisorium scitamineum]|uniref:Uncharacterized protein n=1 Tax=Sporisorium scitamineum TaxID=49012 RepID=A0A0F7SE06_9BASI|nr:hypothetical protein [Sporisorium scitamineum]
MKILFICTAFNSLAQSIFTPTPSVAPIRGTGVTHPVACIPLSSR